MAEMEGAEIAKSLEQQPSGKYQYMYTKLWKNIYTDFDLATKPKTVNNTEDMGLYLLQKLKKKFGQSFNLANYH